MTEQNRNSGIIDFESAIGAESDSHRSRSSSRGERSGGQVVQINAVQMSDLMSRLERLENEAIQNGGRRHFGKNEEKASESAQQSRATSGASSCFASARASRDGSPDGEYGEDSDFVFLLHQIGMLAERAASGKTKNIKEEIKRLKARVGKAGDIRPLYREEEQRRKKDFLEATQRMVGPQIDEKVARMVPISYEQEIINGLPKDFHYEVQAVTTAKTEQNKETARKDIMKEFPKKFDSENRNVRHAVIWIADSCSGKLTHHGTMIVFMSVTEDRFRDTSRRIFERNSALDSLKILVKDHSKLPTVLELQRLWDKPKINLQNRETLFDNFKDLQFSLFDHLTEMQYVDRLVDKLIPQLPDEGLELRKKYADLLRAWHNTSDPDYLPTVKWVERAVNFLYPPKSSGGSKNVKAITSESPADGSSSSSNSEKKTPKQQNPNQKDQQIVQLVKQTLEPTVAKLEACAQQPQPPSHYVTHDHSAGAQVAWREAADTRSAMREQTAEIRQLTNEVRNVVNSQRQPEHPPAVYYVPQPTAPNPPPAPVTRNSSDSAPRDSGYRNNSGRSNAPPLFHRDTEGFHEVQNKYEKQGTAQSEMQAQFKDDPILMDKGLSLKAKIPGQRPTYQFVGDGTQFVPEEPPYTAAVFYDSGNGRKVTVARRLMEKLSKQCLRCFSRSCGWNDERCIYYNTPPAARWCERCSRGFHVRNSCRAAI